MSDAEKPALPSSPAPTVLKSAAARARKSDRASSDSDAKPAATPATEAASDGTGAKESSASDEAQRGDQAGADQVANSTTSAPEADKDEKGEEAEKAEGAAKPEKAVKAKEAEKSEQAETSEKGGTEGAEERAAGAAGSAADDRSEKANAAAAPEAEEAAAAGAKDTPDSETAKETTSATTTTVSTATDAEPAATRGAKAADPIAKAKRKERRMSAGTAELVTEAVGREEARQAALNDEIAQLRDDLEVASMRRDAAQARVDAARKMLSYLDSRRTAGGSTAGGSSHSNTPAGSRSASPSPATVTPPSARSPAASAGPSPATSARDGESEFSGRCRKSMASLLTACSAATKAGPSRERFGDAARDMMLATKQMLLIAEEYAEATGDPGEVIKSGSNAVKDNVVRLVRAGKALIAADKPVSVQDAEFSAAVRSVALSAKDLMSRMSAVSSAPRSAGPSPPKAAISSAASDAKVAAAAASSAVARSKRTNDTAADDDDDDDEPPPEPTSLAPGSRGASTRSLNDAAVAWDDVGEVSASGSDDNGMFDDLNEGTPSGVRGAATAAAAAASAAPAARQKTPEPANYNTDSGEDDPRSTIDMPQARMPRRERRVPLSAAATTAQDYTSDEDLFEDLKETIAPGGYFVFCFLLLRKETTR